ncbi:MAG: condensation domain-containing protein, partial [Clostridiales bacterium]|nr:condensation domain-containing protein [Clostridiales bacterium]
MERCYFDLSEPQKSIWLTHQVYDEMNHSVTVDVLFRDKADLAAAQRAVNALYLYNQILRAELTDTDGVPKQFFHAYEEGKAYAVIRAFSNPDAYKKWAEEYALQKMGDTLCEISVVDAGTEFGFLIKASHMIIDGMSAVLLLTRLKQYYNAYCLGGEVADTEYRYQDFLERECAYYQDSAGLSRDREYWQKKIAEIDSPTIVSTNNSESVRSQRLLIPLSPDMENSLKRFCEEKGVSEFGVLLSCFALCVSAHFRTDITTIICTILNRVGVKENKTPGMFVNTLPLVLDCARESVTGLSAPEYIKTIQQEFYRASRHFRYSYNHILGEYYQLRGRRELSDITFSYQTFDALSSGDYAREEFAPSWYFCGTQTNSLSFHARREPKEGMKLIFEYQEEKFSEEDIRLFSAHLLESLHSLFANPGQKMADLDMVSARERERILRDFNDTRADYPEDKTMVDLFEGQVRRTPENIALKFLGQTMSYTELNAKANRIAFRLKELGIRPGDHVAILAERRMEIIAGILATLKAGAAYVPIDPGYPAERIRYVLEDSAAGVLLTCQAAAPAGTEIPVLDLCEAGAYAAARENPPCVNSPDDLAYIIYTSGTTGRPKGVMIEHRGVMN